jgi:aminopeptidase N
LEAIVNSLVKRLLTQAGLVLAGVVLCTSGLLAGDADMIDWDKASPSEIHERLGQSKAQALLDQQFYRKLMAQEKAISNQTGYDVLHYDIFMRINDTTEWIYGQVGVTAEVVDMFLQVVELDLLGNMTVDSVVTDSSQLSFSHPGDILSVDLGRAFGPGEQLSFTVFYDGHPTEGGFQGFSFDTRATGKVMSSLSEPYFARSWWPCKDRMDDKADTYSIAIEVDTSFYVASNGTLDSVVQPGGNTHTYYYSVGYPMVTYLFSLAISKYTVWYDEYVYNDGADTLPLVHAVYPDWYSYSLPRYGETPNMMAIFEEAFGPYPFRDEKYGHANFEWGGGMEHQTMSSMGGSSFGFSLPVVAHELAHQWWGDMITCETWTDIWLNEGWASYAEAVWTLAEQGWGAYQSYMNGMAYTGGGTIHRADTTDVWSIFHGGLSYDKASWVVHMLRGMLGDSLFFVGIDAYYNSEHQHGSATTEDFKNVWEAASGWELDFYFDQWIYGTYRPNYNWAWLVELSDSAGYDLYIWTKQVQTSQPQVFTMPIPFVVSYSGGGNDTLKLWVDQREQILRANVPANVTSVQLDPADWVLKYQSVKDFGVRLITMADEIDTATQYTPFSYALEARGGTGDYLFVFSGGTLPNGVALGSDGVLSGVPTEFGDYSFQAYVTDDVSTGADWRTYTLTVVESDGLPGDVIPDGSVNVADLTALVDFLFGGGPAPLNPNQADVDASCTINVQDVTYLTSYLFQSGPAPVMGCVQ